MQEVLEEVTHGFVGDVAAHDYVSVWWSEEWVGREGQMEGQGRKEGRRSGMMIG